MSYNDYHRHEHKHYNFNTLWPSIAVVVVAALVVWFFKS
jgi:hypothetical protein